MTKSAILAAATFALVAFTAESHAADPGFCAGYARSAVAQFYANRRIPGCFHGANRAWHGDYGYHFGWCLRASYGAAESERASRRHTLAGCRWRAGW